jgi:hypothetical protein
MNTIRYLKKAWRGSSTQPDAQNMSGTPKGTPTCTPSSSAHGEFQSGTNDSNRLPTLANEHTTFSAPLWHTPGSQATVQSSPDLTRAPHSRAVSHNGSTSSEKAQVSQSTLPSPADLMNASYNPFSFHNDTPELDGAQAAHTTFTQQAAGHISISTNRGTTQKELAEDESYEELSNDNTNNDRSKLPPKRPQQARHRPAPHYTRPDFASQVIMEEFNNLNDPMPKGYIGTFGGHRFCATTVEDYCPCGTYKTHYLNCGHTVIDTSTCGDSVCGANCKTGLNAEQPFNCTQCRNIIDDIFDKKLTVAEREHIRFYRDKSDALTIALLVEYITKHMPNTKGNIAETVVSIVMQQGRTCIASICQEEAPRTLADMFREREEALRRETRAFMDKLELNKQEKRKNFCNESDIKGTEDTETDSPNTSSSPQAVEKGNKKQKTKLATHWEPISEETRGIKRTATYIVDDRSDGKTFVDNVASSANTTNKKLRKKLEICHESISAPTSGMKRNIDLSDPPYGSTPKSKRTSSTPSRALEEISFLPTPPKLGHLVRKRVQEAELEGAVDRLKRARSLVALPDQRTMLT